MQSKTSCFNGTLFRKNLTRFWPLWGLASFIGALFPLAVLLDMVHRGPDRLHRGAVHPDVLRGGQRSCR